MSQNPLRWFIGFYACLLLLCLTPNVEASSGYGVFNIFVLDTRVFLPGTGEGISNAFVLDTLAFTTGSIAGVVKSQSGSPISGAEVSAEGRYSTTSNEDGSYTLENVLTGYGYRVAARAGGYSTALAENVNVYQGRATTVNFTLSSVSETYQITELYPLASIESSVYEEGMAIRYYKVRTASGSIPQGTVRARWEIRKGGSVVQTTEYDTNADGEVMVWANTKGTATAGQTLTGTLLSLNGVSIPSTQRPTFTVNVLEAPFRVSYRQRVNGELQGSIIGKARIGGEAGFDLTYPCTSSSGSSPTGMEILRKTALKAGVGVEKTLFEAGAEYETTHFTAGLSAGVGANAEVLGVKKHNNRYEFVPNAILGSSADWNQSAAAFIALNDTFGMASGQEIGLDAAMLYILSWVEQQALGSGGPLTALNDSYTFSESGFGVAAEAGAQANLLAGVAGQTQGTIQLGVSANATLRGEGEATIDLGYDKKDMVFLAGNSVRLEGTLSTAIGAGASYRGVIGWPRQTGIPNLTLLPKQRSYRDNFGWTLASAAWTGGAGLEYRYRVLYSGSQKQITQVIFEVAPFQRVNFQSNLRRFVYTATSTDPRVLNNFAGATSTGLAQLLAVGSGGAQSLGISGDHGRLLFGFIDVCNQIANGADSGKLNVALEIYNEPATILSDTNFTLKGKLLGTGGKVKLGERAEEVFRYPVFRGVWRDGRDFILEDYSQADFQKPAVKTYQETQQKLLDTVIIQPLEDAWERVIQQAQQGIATIIEIGGKTIQFAADAIQGGQQIIATIWNMFMGGQGKAIPTGTREYAIAKRILTEAQEQAGLQFGIGGFLNLQTEDNAFSGTALMTFSYTDSDVIGVDETRLAAFWYDPEDGNWVYMGGIPDAENNQVVVTIDRLGTFTLAPTHPEGQIGMDPNPSFIPVGGGAEAEILCGPLLDSAGDPVPDDTAYTITTDLGTLIAEDHVPSASGLQVLSSSGELSFTLRSALIGGIANLRIESLFGRAVGEATVEFTDNETPFAPTNLLAKPDDEGAWLYWADNTEPDLAGYRIYFGTESGGPYNGGASVRGLPSPINVGFATQAYLPGLINGQDYFVVVTALDHGGNESEPSLEVPVRPTMKGDLDGDGEITRKDFFQFSTGYGSRAEARDYIPLADINGDRSVDAEDLLRMMGSLDSSSAAKKSRQKALLRSFGW